jgi:hypothetical protein
MAELRKVQRTPARALGFFCEIKTLLAPHANL